MNSTGTIEVERLWIVKCQYRTHDKQYPEMAPMIEEYKASGGSYSDIVPSIVNMLK